MKNLLPSLFVLFAYQASANNFADSSKIYFEKGVLEKAAKHYLVASSYFDKAIKFNPKFAEAYIENAFVNLEMRRTDAAKANFVKANELKPSNTVVIKELATLYYSYRQWDKAIEFVSKCNDCDNRDRIIGMCNFEKENYADAEKYLIKALIKSPEDAQINYFIARNYIDMDAYKRAVPYFEKAVSLDATKSTWAYELGLLYYNNNNFKSAATSFENAVKNGYIANNDFNENYGYSLMYSGQFEKGEKTLLEIYKKKGNKEMLRDIAQTLYEQKQYQRALDYCQRLMEIDPKDGKALYQAGLSFIKMGNKNKGQGMCDKAIQLDPSLAGKKSSVSGDEFGL
jgi:tetratricopeptide (TPR) repeat protein